MLIIGAKGFAKEVLQILHQNGDLDQLAFYDDITPDIGDKLLNQFTVLKSIDQAEHFFNVVDKRFTIGIGNPFLRFKMYQKFTERGGVFSSTVSKGADIGSYEVSIEPGSNILSGVKISNNTKIGIGCMIYYNSIITHEVEIGKFVEISPGATLLGRCKIGDFTHIGSGAIILPDVIVGNDVVIAAGAVVTRNIQNNVMVAGVPAVIKKQLLKVSL